jgi:hypothetical protein
MTADGGGRRFVLPPATDEEELVRGGMAGGVSPGRRNDCLEADTGRSFDADPFGLYAPRREEDYFRLVAIDRPRSRSDFHRSYSASRAAASSASISFALRTRACSLFSSDWDRTFRIRLPTFDADPFGLYAPRREEDYFRLVAIDRPRRDWELKSLGRWKSDRERGRSIATRRK